MATLTEMFHIKDTPKRKGAGRGSIPHSNKKRNGAAVQKSYLRDGGKFYDRSSA